MYAHIKSFLLSNNRSFIYKSKTLLKMTFKGQKYLQRTERLIEVELYPLTTALSTCMAFSALQTRVPSLPLFTANCKRFPSVCPPGYVQEKIADGLLLQLHDNVQLVPSITITCPRRVFPKYIILTSNGITVQRETGKTGQQSCRSM